MRRRGVGRVFRLRDDDVLEAGVIAGRRHADIAADVGKTAKQVTDRVRRLGLAVPEDTDRRRALLAGLFRRHRHPTGRFLAKMLGCSVQTVRHDLRAVGLYESYDAGRRARLAKLARGTMTRARADRQAVRCVRAGWPAVTLGMLRTLEAVEAVGPDASLAALARRLGITNERWLSKKLLTLVRAGHLTSRRERYAHLYTLSPAVAESRRLALERAERGDAGALSVAVATVGESDGPRRKAG